MHFRSQGLLVGIAIAHLGGCASTSRPTDWELAHEPYPEAKAELRVVLEKIIHDAETANVDGLREVHLESEKFTKFGGGDIHERMDYAQTIDVETAAITSVQDYKSEARDVKIDIFGDVAVLTYYPHRVVTKSDEVVRYSTRQTLVFLKTSDRWRIVHEHQSPKQYDLAHYTFPDAKEELQAVIQSMAEVSANGDTATLAAMHLDSDKFTRFGGADFERVGYDECVARETAFYSTVKDLVWDVQDLKIDVFGKFAVASVQAGLTYTLEGAAQEGEFRLTLVFLETADGWKIVHEHGTPKACFERAGKPPQRYKGSGGGDS